MSEQPEPQLPTPSPYQKRRTNWPLSLVILAAGLIFLLLALKPPTPSEAYVSEQHAYLTENAQKDGVTTTDSGLQIEHEVVGEGAQPTAADTVTVHYAGKLIDGTTFDSSYDRGQPISFPLTQVIAGWTEGLQLMKEGGKAELTIPAELGYGERGAGGVIPGGATLVFTVELLKVN